MHEVLNDCTVAGKARSSIAEVNFKSVMPGTTGHVRRPRRSIVVQSARATGARAAIARSARAGAARAASSRAAKPPFSRQFGCTQPNISPSVGVDRCSVLPVHEKVLIVEDNALIALGLREFLAEVGFEVVGTAATMSEAPLRLGEHVRPDIAIADVRIAGQHDGIETALELQQRARPQAITSGSTPGQ